MLDGQQNSSSVTFAECAVISPAGERTGTGKSVRGPSNFSWYSDNNVPTEVIPLWIGVLSARRPPGCCSGVALLHSSASSSCSTTPCKVSQLSTRDSRWDRLSLLQRSHDPAPVHFVRDGFRSISLVTASCRSGELALMSGLPLCSCVRNAEKVANKLGDHIPVDARERLRTRKTHYADTCQ